MAHISLDNLTYTYPAAKKPALDGITLDIEEGTFTAIVGRNNAGKTSLCYALAGVIPHLYGGDMAGRVLVDGLDTRESDVADLGLRVGLVMQNPASQFSGARFTVFEEVAFGLENRGVERDLMAERVERALRLAGIGDLGTRSPAHLSGGQQQKVALASVLVSDPDVLVLDESTTFLDPSGAVRVFETLDGLCREGRTVILAEHRLEWIARFADRVVVLDHGRVALDGPPAEVLASPELSRTGLPGNRYTEVARLARELRMWDKGRALAVTLEQAVTGLEAGGER
ncbi:Energy-coupling factor transporter ATP-binding protein EcfA1 [Pseudodesulfovibrio hydrargyri]|uniref:Energy-coupling factor transporter ATP-binding protein EcfA1 n=1 Tax=Pseudodesulfovibrio hydrargyri TaxID=2125990 RepID=A0A1J5N0C7_9BACT|nr:ABC transporter ATP-binding protein [Pseudodesulfovibrio hydrargyri]OIQ52245.1 Energy-coupling factor transporter ATP-binding protein EcfA1 [Pseudodesulfovibrio hydrargyri]